MQGFVPSGSHRSLSPATSNPTKTSLTKPFPFQPRETHSSPTPNFVGSFTQSDFVYFFFRETAVEFINCGKSIFSRVARVCKWDKGGPNRLKNRWTSYLKSRLNCSMPGDFPFYFDEIRKYRSISQSFCACITLPGEH
ncbi:semaphorin [Anopheles sinensis]|uniref:Semaphorin n=1 Tax=Anopheles sinensis TaxID=74873 RepID=A0A084WQR0_ANOSI|nr:semaphorin [Anopheles sinensis]